MALAKQLSRPLSPVFCRCCDDDMKNAGPKTSRGRKCSGNEIDSEYESLCVANLVLKYSHRRVMKTCLRNDWEGLNNLENLNAPRISLKRSLLDPVTLQRNVKVTVAFYCTRM